MQFGKIQFIPGEMKGRYPFCNSLFIDDRVKVVVDPGAGLDRLTRVRDTGCVEMVLNTHCHFDHLAYNYLFDQAGIYINEHEGGCFGNIEEVARSVGVAAIYGEEWVQGWVARVSRQDTPQSPYSPQNRHEWVLSTARLAGTYRWGQVFDLGRTRMEVVGAPGHSRGFSCLYFPGEGAVYTADIDLTGFGPWYGGRESDIDLFIESARKIADLDARYFITGHEAGVLGKKEFREGLDAFLEIIDAREQRIASALERPLARKDIAGLGLMYGKKFLVDAWVRAWEEIMVAKHLDRMVDRGELTFDGEKYRRAGSQA
jgi:glyoxylase-like metal-dependent hydrolase (beta-lactamase superfamily II)